MSNKVFVGGLHWRTTEPSLKKAFAKVAEVAAVRIILDKETGRSRCFGFVTFASPELAPETLARCQGIVLDGRALKVSMAREKPSLGETGGCEQQEARASVG